MSLLKANSVQIGQSATATNNFTLSVPSSPDGTIKLARGNSGATTADILSVNASGAITGTITGATINSSTINGGSITLGTAQNTTSGTAIDFTGIPSWAKKITVMFNSVSTSGSSSILIQCGNSGGIVGTGYVSTSNHLNNASGSSGSNSTAGFIFFSNSSTFTHSGIITICNLSGSIWVCSIIGKSNTAHNVFGGGNGTISSLDRIRITTVNGTDTFNAGSVNIMYEG